MPKITGSGLAGLLLALALFAALPEVAGGQWQKIFTSTTCFTLAAMGGLGSCMRGWACSVWRYVIAVASFGFLLIEAHRRTAPGRAWALIRRSEAAAMASGVNVTLYKTWAFGLSGLLAGLGGGLLAGSLGLLDAATFKASESALLFALVVVGGPRFWLGAVITAMLYRVVPGLLNNWGVDADLALVFFGAGLLHAVITAPQGISGQIFNMFGRGKRV